MGLNPLCAQERSDPGTVHRQERQVVTDLTTPEKDFRSFVIKCRETFEIRSPEESRSGSGRHQGGDMSRNHVFRVKALWEERVCRSLKILKPEEPK
jgi:hypothetical protein